MPAAGPDTGLLESPRLLLADEMLGRLARWLRVLGFDTGCAAGLPDDGVLEWARREGRVLLTRDTGLMRRRIVREGVVTAVFIRDDLLADQLGQLTEECGLSWVGPPRCLVCNGWLRRVSPNEAAGRVPEYVAATHAAFRHCASCDRYVWEGTHWCHMREFLARVGVAEA